MVLPEGQPLDTDEAEFRRRALLLLAEIRDTNERICRAVEQVLGRQPDDPRYKQTGSWR